MSRQPQVPDYALDETRTVTTTREIRAMFHPLRGDLLQLLLTRAASIQELAAAVGRPKGTIAHHVRVLAEADLVRVVRTRTVRGQDERFYGRTARLFGVGQVTADQAAMIPRTLAQWDPQTLQAHEADELRAVRRHAWISDDDADAFWDRILEVVTEFSQRPDGGQPRAQVLQVAFYPHVVPRLPEAEA